MKLRKKLLLVTSLVFVFGLVGAAIPFFQSMNPSDAVRENAKLRIKLSEIPENVALEASYRWHRAFVVKNPRLTVFLMPYMNEAYGLPDMTWERAFIPCEKFISDEEGFSCEDPNLHKSWNDEATWDLTGQNKGTWMPDLQKINFILEDEYLILSPEYE